MEELIILDRLEEEHLVRALESAVQVKKLRQLLLWTQGAFQGLLPHGVLVCVHFGESDNVLRVECLHGVSPDIQMIQRLCHLGDGLAVRLAQYCRSHQRLPCVIERGAREEHHPLSVFQTEVLRCQLGNALVHGTENLSGGASFFALFMLPEPPGARQAFFLELLLPCLHLAFQRVISLGNGETYVATNTSAQVLTVREIEILRWVTKGKSNSEIGEIIALSPLTVKNHVHNIYRKLNVHNRVQAVARGHALQLLNGLES